MNKAKAYYKVDKDKNKRKPTNITITRCGRSSNLAI